MTVKVVQGLIGQTRPPTQPSIVTQEQVAQQLGSASAAASQAGQAAAAVRQVGNDAVLVSTRAVTKSSSPALRDSEKAQRVADEVAEDIRKDPATGAKAHDSLSSSRASQYL